MVERFRSLWAAGAFLNGGRVPFAHTLFIHGAALTANVSGALPAAPPTPPAPGQQNRRLCRFPRLHFLASGRSGYGILPLPQARVHAGLTWLVNSGSAILMPDPLPNFDFLMFY